MPLFSGVAVCRPRVSGFRLAGFSAHSAHSAKGIAASFAAAVAAPVFMLMALLAGFAATASAGSMPGSVRVLVYDQRESVEVSSIPSASGRVAQRLKMSIDVQGRLRVDGQVITGTWAPGAHPSGSANAGPAPLWTVGDHRYRGEIRARAAEGRIEILNRVGLDDYVASILGSEMSANWPADALRAQAVASRTYALYHAQRRKEERWDVEATVSSQVYRGVEAESPETRAATRATAGQILTFHDAPILAVFHSTAGGQTATASEVWGEDHPYLRSISVEEEAAPHTYWRVRFGAKDFAAILSAAGLSVGTVQSLSVSSRTDSGRAGTLRIEGTRGVETLQGDVLRSMIGALGLRSKLFDVRQLENGFVFVGSGYGHGVGMSQWGARVMAERGDSYQRILAQFYPGARLERHPEAFLASHGQSGPGAESITPGRQAQGDRP